MHAVSIVRESLDFPELSACGIKILLLSHYQLKPTKSIIVASHFEFWKADKNYFENCFEQGKILKDDAGGLEINNHVTLEKSANKLFRPAAHSY